MLAAYLTTLFIGASLLALSLFAGGDHDADGEVSVDGDASFEHDGDGDFEVGGFDAWLPIASLRFWTFFAAFFGLVGTALSAASSLGTVPIAIASGGVGYVSGVVARQVVRRLSRERISSSVGSDELVGTTGVLTLPVAPGHDGKIRMEIGGRTLEIIAESDEDSIVAGASALVIAVRDNGTVVVSPAARLEA